MPTNRLRPRRHSLSSGDESIHPHPAKLDGLPRQDSRRRARLPRSKSTSAFDVFRRPPGATGYDANNIALEQTDIASLRELAKFLRTTGPPPDRPVTHDECLRLSGSGEPRRWSLQSLRRNKRFKLERHSSLQSQSHLPENAKPGTTAEGHPYIAISTPVPENTRVDGPWFRSQYPIYLPQSPPTSHGAWPERSSSKAAVVTTIESGVSTAAAKATQRSAGSPANHEPERILRASKLERHTRALSNRVSTDQLLRAMLNTVDEGFEKDLGASLKQLGIQRSPIVERLAQPPQMQTALPVVMLDREDLPRRSASLTRPARDESQVRPRSSLSLKDRGSPRSSGRLSRRPANMLVQTTLAVPKKNIPPESPGFPNMLATMTFPSPPKGSRPSSPATTSPSVSEKQTPPRPGPMVQPRTSSRRACTSTTVSAASLDEIVMQRRPSSRHAKAEVPAQAQTPPHSGTGFDASPKNRLWTEPKESPFVEYQKRMASDEPLQTSCNGDKDHQRESQASQLTATTSSGRQSVSTNRSSRSSSTSDMSTHSKSTVTPPKRDSKESHAVGHIDPPAPEQGVAQEDGSFKTNGAAKRDEALEGNSNPESRITGLDKPHGLLKKPGLYLSTTNIENSPQPKSIFERRLARKAKVREYKMRDLDASRIEAADSPILGYFAPTLPDPNYPSHQGPSLVAYNPRRPSTLSTTTTVSEASNDLNQATDRTDTPSLPHHVPPLTRDEGQVVTKKEFSASTGGLKMSAVVMTDIEPIYPPSPHWHTSGITINLGDAVSPIMVVANVESRPGSPTLHPSVATRADSYSPRVMAGTKSLKVGSHTRQKNHSVTISRNPSTGAIERFALGPTDYKFNRRSLINMPTPPMSPETTRMSRRLSLPPVQMSLPITPRERTPPSRRQEWHASHVEREPDTRSRSATLKERVMREKLQKEKEITDIVARTVGLPQKEQREASYEDEPSSLPSDGYNAETLEKRLRRLERNNDAWLCAMKPLLEAMARTLEDMRADDRSSSLRMSDFIIDTDVEARRFSISQRSRHGERESTLIMLQGLSADETKVNEAKSGRSHYHPTVLSPVPQELDDPSSPDQRLTPISLGMGWSSAEKGASSTVQQAIEQQDQCSWGHEAGPGKTSSTVEGRPNLSRSGASSGERGLGTRTQPGSTDEVDDTSDLSDLDPLIQELGNMTRLSQESKRKENGVDQDAKRNRVGVNALNPLMRELMSASKLSTEEVMNVR